MLNMPDAPLQPPVSEGDCKDKAAPQADRPPRGSCASTHRRSGFSSFGCVSAEPNSAPPDAVAITTSATSGHQALTRSEAAIGRLGRREHPDLDKLHSQHMSVGPYARMGSVLTTNATPTLRTCAATVRWFGRAHRSHEADRRCVKLTAESGHGSLTWQFSESN